MEDEGGVEGVEDGNEEEEGEGAAGDDGEGAGGVEGEEDRSERKGGGTGNGGSWARVKGRSKGEVGQ